MNLIEPKSHFVIEGNRLENSILFHKEIHQSKAKVIAVFPMDNQPDKSLLITDVTPFNPIDYIWGDQPSDIGTLKLKGTTYNISNSFMVAQKQGDSKVYLHKDIPFRKQDEGICFAIAHLVEGLPYNDDYLSAQVELSVDLPYRQGLSHAHSAAHLMALALNQALASYWKKPCSLYDALEHPNFDALAITHSKIEPYESLDRFRVGKSLRKKGFYAQRFLENHQEIINKVQETLKRWTLQQSAISIGYTTDKLADIRFWKSKIDEKNISIPCGGTHASNISLLKGINFQINLLETNNLDFTFEIKTKLNQSEIKDLA